jgi:radical SAM/Cys-rich protein
MHDMMPRLAAYAFPAIRRSKLETLQVNLGYLCNQVCLHCHVNAGPKRTELMSRETVDQLLAYIDKQAIKTLDLTGGAPEMNPEFKYLVEQARQRGVHVIDRCNLTILQVPGYEDMAQFLAEQQVEIVASLPCYLEDNVDAQRGKGVFGDSIKSLQQLNALGYGVDGSGLELSLVYNPQGPSLPPPQEALEADYKAHLKAEFDIVFTRLFALANLPVQRFGSTLVSKGEFEPYMETLKASHSDDNLAGVMCRSTLSVDWQGYVYDCDFNQMLKMPLAATQDSNGQGQTHIADLLSTELENSPIAVAGHCYGCTAGQGSSCGGALN